MPKSIDKSALQRLLGMIKYLSHFIKDLSNKTVILKSLLNKKSEWYSHESHGTEFIK